VSDDRRIAAYYDARVDEFGHDPRAVDASSQASLDVRYRSLSAVADLSGKRVLEVGCGFGDLGAYIAARHEGVRYRGVDLSPRMVEEGRRAHPGLDLEVGNVLALPPRQDYDIVLAQGIFYLLREDPEARVRELVTQMFALASEAVALTAMSTWAAEPDPDEYQLDPALAVAIGRSLTKAVVLRHDYHPADLTLYLYRRDWT
jgi:SAM-dependent methyltransferase